MTKLQRFPNLLFIALGLGSYFRPLLFSRYQYALLENGTRKMHSECFSFGFFFFLSFFVGLREIVDESHSFVVLTIV